jgi:hypothetical protein
MGAVTATRAAGATRLVALGGIRIAGLAVAVGAAAVGAAYLIVSIVGDTVASPGAGIFELERGLLSGLPFGLRLLNAISFLLACLVVSGMAWIIADLAWRVRRGVRFDTAVSRSTAALAVVLALGATVVQFVRNLMLYTGLRYPEDVDPATVDRASLPLEWGVGTYTFVPNFTLLGLAVVLGVLAYIIRAGERLQRDTEGLV